MIQLGIFFIFCLPLVWTEIIQNVVELDGSRSLPLEEIIEIPSFNVPIKLGLNIFNSPNVLIFLILDI